MCKIIIVKVKHNTHQQLNLECVCIGVYVHIYVNMCAGFCMSTRIYIYIYLKYFLSEYLCIRTMCTYFPLHVHISKNNKRFDHKKKMKPSPKVIRIQHLKLDPNKTIYKAVCSKAFKTHFTWDTDTAIQTISWLQSPKVSSSSS